MPKVWGSSGIELAGIPSLAKNIVAILSPAKYILTFREVLISDKSGMPTPAQGVPHRSATRLVSADLIK